MRKYKGFTLAEVMIVLTVIGVLTAILLPVARQSMPDENLMKFKKAHNTLGTVIRELVTSDKYYKDGDLGVKPDDTLIDAHAETDTEKRKALIRYFCETIAQVVNAKKVSCVDEDITSSYMHLDLRNGHDGYGKTLEEGALYVDEACQKSIAIGEEIVLNDGTVFYQTKPPTTFGYAFYTGGGTYYVGRHFGGDKDAAHYDANGFGAMYKMFCIDIDGIPTAATVDDCVNECPFGYGIRADGKIFVGARAQQWLEREVNEE